MLTYSMMVEEGYQSLGKRFSNLIKPFSQKTLLTRDESKCETPSSSGKEEICSEQNRQWKRNRNSARLKEMKLFSLFFSGLNYCTSLYYRTSLFLMCLSCKWGDWQNSREGEKNNVNDYQKSNRDIKCILHSVRWSWCYFPLCYDAPSSKWSSLFWRWNYTD